MESECKKYLDKGPLNVIVVVWSDRGGPGPLAPLWIRAWHLSIPSKTAAWIPEFAVEDLPSAEL